MHDLTIVKVVGGALLSAFLTVGGLSYSNKTDITTQQIRIERLERQELLISGLTDQLALTNQNIAILNVKLANLQEDLDELKESRK